MASIDHRILIPKPSERVWQYVSDLSMNSTWQVNCRSLSFLNTKHSGVGIRWRMTTANGREQVGEVTAWYEGLGYEYTLVDGAAFKSNKGRIRLQEIPEGTIVEWTFDYEMAGFLSGMRDALSVRRQVEQEIVESLKQLWRVMGEAKERERYESKTAMRDAPDYESRSHYKARHAGKTSPPPPETVEIKPKVVEAPPVQIVEPPITQEDTRPRLPVLEPTSITDEVPAAKVESLAVLAISETVATKTDEAKAVLAPQDETPPRGMPPVTLDIAVPELPSKADDSKSMSVVTDKAKSALMPGLATAKIPLDMKQTSDVSIFELFGLPKPSETKPTPAVDVPIATTEPMPVVATALMPLVSAERRIGVRLRLRRQLVKLRKP